MDIRKKYILLLLFSAVVLAAGATYTDGYYNRMDGLKREALKAAAKECVSAHRTLVYTDLPTYWQYSDVYPQLVDGCKRWWEMYSNEVYLIESVQTARQSFSANKMQREHAVPKSWWKSGGSVEYTPAYSDMWNLFPSDGPANQAKLNYPLGPTTGNPSFNNGVTKVGSVVDGYGGGSGKVFEPADEYKGDFARAYFYMAVVYDDLPWCVNYMYQADSQWPTLKPWAYEMLLQWSRLDPVSQKEIDRNDAVEECQGNRNPFVDFPELAEYIWGTRVNDVFYLSEQGGSVTPPITGDPELTAPVNGSSVDFGQVAVGNSINGVVVIEGSNLTSSLSVRIAGTDKNLFVPEITSIPAVNVNQGSRYLLNIVYTPQSPGRHTARLLLYDGGLPDGFSVAVDLIGEAFPVPELTRLTAYDPEGLTDNSYTAVWSEATEVVDYYEVVRTRYYETGEESDIYQTDKTEYLITDRDPAVTESYRVSSCRLGFRSEPSNSIVVAATSGVGGVRVEAPLRLYVTEDGFSVAEGSACRGLSVYDTTGRLILQVEEIRGGETFSLPAGIYIITTRGDMRPVKIAIL